MFQVPEMAYDPVTRTTALMSLVCALMSLTFGCLFIIRFGTMRSMHRASTWAEVSPIKIQVYASLISATGGAEDADINPVECVGPACNPLDMVSLVGNHVHRFDTFVRVESWGNK